MSIWNGKREDFKPELVPHKYYVYALKLELHQTPIYIGKGSNNRAALHHISSGNKAIGKVLKKAGSKYYVEILASSDNEAVVFQLEKSFISKFGRRIEGGLLLNFSSGGKYPLDNYFKIESVRRAFGERMTKRIGKAMFVDGFIFPSMRGAARALGVDRNHIKYFLRIGKAFFLNGNTEGKHEQYLRLKESELHTYRESFDKKNATKLKNWYTRKVSVDGKVYDSVTEAAYENGLKPSSIVTRIKNGNRKNTYYVEER